MKSDRALGAIPGIWLIDPGFFARRNKEETEDFQFSGSLIPNDVYSTGLLRESGTRLVHERGAGGILAVVLCGFARYDRD